MTSLTRRARRARGQIGADSPRTVVVASEPDQTLHADQRLLEPALGNLVDNAVRHGEGTITIDATRPYGAAAAILTVHDQGHGIPPDFLPHAAERFRRNETSRTGPGTGLGLSLVDAIMTLTAVSCASAPAAFTTICPLAPRTLLGSRVRTRAMGPPPASFCRLGKSGQGTQPSSKIRRTKTDDNARHRVLAQQPPPWPRGRVRWT